MALHVGGQAIGEVYVGADPIAEGWLWDGAAWSQVYRAVPPFAGARLDKAGTQTLAAANVWYAVAGWTPAAGTVVEDGGVRVPAGVAVSVSSSVAWGAAASFGDFQRVRVMNGSTLVASGERTYGQGNPSAAGSFAGTGELVTLEAQTTSTSFSRNVVNAAGTYLQLAVVNA